MAIAPKPLVETDTVSIRFPRPLVETLDAYCKYLGGASDRSYVIVEAVRQVIERDKEFQKAARKTAGEAARDRKRSAGAAGPVQEGAA